MELLVISGSTRRGSFNTRLARLVRDVRPDDQVTVVSDLAALPFYDADVEATGIPSAVTALRGAVAVADVVVFVTPEYNGTVPGVLGNAVDWLSRPHGESVLQRKPVLVLSASPSRFGAVRAADHLRTVLHRIGAQVLPAGLSVAGAHRRLAEPVDPEVVGQLADVLGSVLDVRTAPSGSAEPDLLPA
ncbi:NADPH-dependent FMN reductase [Blastococcus deserti]|uniref:NADPH-dependent FMN reductase n=1 Tax=Blastococcus deserti TaxID=2259033 RepID=A0ABW4X839_9ACTN